MIFINPSLDTRVSFRPPTRAAFEYHQRLPRYAPTPLLLIPSFARSAGVEKILVKDESNRFGLPAFKILGASWATYCVMRTRIPDVAVDPMDIDEMKQRLMAEGAVALYSATDGNHGRAVAAAAKMFGLGASIYVPHGTASARIAAIEGEGARVTVVDGTYDAAVARAAGDAESHHGVLIQDNGWHGYVRVPRYVIEGYATMLWEIDAQLEALNEPDPTHVIVQIGVGSFAEAVIRHFRTRASSIVIIGVEPESAACALESVRAGKIVKVPGPHTSIMAGMNCDSPSFVSFPVLQRGVNCFVSLSDDRAREALCLLATHNIVSGETGSAGMGAVLELLSAANRPARDALGLNSRSRILVFSTEGMTDPVSYGHIVHGNA